MPHALVALEVRTRTHLINHARSAVKVGGGRLPVCSADAFARLLADAAYDGEHNHTLCRDELGIRSTVIPLNPRVGQTGPAKTRYRRQMQERFFNRVYG